MWRKPARRRPAPAGALAVASRLFWSAPLQPRAQEADCGGNSGPICQEGKSRWFFFFFFCEAWRYYYSSKPILLESSG